MFKQTFQSLVIALLLACCLVTLAPAVAHAQETTPQLDPLGSVWTEQEDGKESEPPSAAQLSGRLLLAMGAVLALMGGAFWAARRWLPQSAGLGRGGQIEVLATRSLGQRKNLVLVRAKDKTLLLGVCPQSITMLTEMEPDGGLWEDHAMRNGLDLGGETAGVEG